MIKFEELKVMADELGYRLVKKQSPLPKRLPCMCGSKRVDIWYGRHGEFYKCTKCGFESEAGRTKRERIENWNKAVKGNNHDQI